MNRILKLYILLSILTGYTISVFAQGQDTSHQWNGNDVETISTTSDSDLKTVYLYNVGTGKFLNTGSYWGTVVVGFNVGMKVTVAKDPTATDAHKFIMTGPLATTEGNKIAFGRKKDTPGPDNVINYNRVYVDRGTRMDDGHINGILNWQIEAVNYGTNKHVYKLHFSNDEHEGFYGERFLYMDNNTNGKTNNISYPSSVNSGDKNGLWMFVTQKDLKEAFKETYASDEKPADATFLIFDQNFERGNIYVNKWQTSDGITSKYNTSTYLFNPADPNETFYVGNGAIKSDYYMANYAGYTNANVRNIGQDTKANGKVYQTVTTLRKGWYRLSCNGFYNASSGSSMVSKLFAKVQGTNNAISNTETPLERFNHEFVYTKADLTRSYGKDDLAPTLHISPYVNAGLEFEKNKYKNVILVYVPADNQHLDIGIEIKNSTEDLDWTCWDNIQLEYCGNRDLVLSENETDIDYIKQQVDPNTATTLILKRSLELGKWNSIILPVDMTKGQLKSAFGEQVKLSELPHQSANRVHRIDFKSVNLDGNENEVALKANQLYIIYPTKSPVGNSTEQYSKQLKNNSTISVAAPYYIINNIILKTDPTTLSGFSNGIIKDPSTTSTTTDQSLQFCGSLINQTNKVVPKYSYVLGKDGKWGFTTKEYPIKGFRTWIATGAVSGAGAAPYKMEMSFYIDDIKLNDVSGIITGINSVLDMNNSSANEVYNLNGQRIDAEALSGGHLPKGIYIINNKKVIIK